MPGSNTVRCEVLRWETRTHADGTKHKTRDLAKDKSGDKDKYALEVDKHYDKDGDLTSTKVRVNSPHILGAFRKAIGKHFSVASNFEKPTTLKEPFQMLIHHWDDLQRYIDDEEDDDVRMHVTLLMEWMESELGEVKEVLDSEAMSARCTYDTAWAIYKPGQPVMTRIKSHPWLLSVVKTVYEESTRIGKYFEVHCRYTNCNGTNVGVTNEVIRMRQKEYFGQGDPAVITELPVYPRVYDDAGAELEKELYERGLRFLELAKQMAVYRYDGLAMSAKTPPPWYYDPDETEENIVWLPFTESGRVIVDNKTFGKEHVAKHVTPRKQLERADIISCPPSVFGYSCSIKEWCRFFLPNIGKPQWRTDPFNELVLSSEEKDLVQALVSSHNFPDNPEDQALAKGRGLTILLHGSPGSGKTLTAESSAELTHKALLSCSLSEINKYNEPHSFERRLSKILRLATVWQAVVLMDEADVFLEARQDESMSGPDRNALVAVFLKQLEYFAGIIFLTTNRVTVFDAAMQSRIHLALRYEPPGHAARRVLWEKQISRIPSSPSGQELAALLDLVEFEPLNGREIANSVMTAATLARFRSEPFSSKHVENILQVHRDFRGYLKKKRQDTATREQLAKRNGSYLPRTNSLMAELAIDEENSE